MTDNLHSNFGACAMSLRITLLMMTVMLSISSAGWAADEPSQGDGTSVGFAFTELPPSVRELRYAFACPDGLEIEMCWIAQDVGDAAPANFVIGRVAVTTRGPLNVARLSRPKNGWPLGLYRLELRRSGKAFHTVYYAIEEPPND